MASIRRRLTEIDSQLRTVQALECERAILEQALDELRANGIA